MDGIIFAEGNGFGHVAREARVSKELGFPIMTFGDGAEYGRSLDLDIIEIPSPYQVKTVKDKVNVVSGFENILSFFSGEGLKTIREQFKKADFVIADGAFLGFYIAQSMEKKHIYVTNDTMTMIGIHGSFQKNIARSISEQLLKKTNIVIPDFNPPFTVTYKNLDATLPMTFSGPLIQKFKQVRHNKKYLVSGNLRDSIEPLLGDLAAYGSTVGLNSYYSSCEVVICHGGHSTIMEALSFGKPILCIGDKTYLERYNNSKTIQENNLGVFLDKAYLNKENLEAAILYAKTADKKRLATYKAYANELDGVKLIKRKIEEIF